MPHGLTKYALNVSHEVSISAPYARVALGFSTMHTNALLLRDPRSKEAALGVGIGSSSCCSMI
ncbi:hypothetical protein M426DRAFT_181480 [Hypoxylon sp. CI-4A]|nr:hypothetical protein M426DRAFT_181480 [Hypoxylon sp. CI-4A]